ncbi:MAG: 4-hydroxy-tetrahydrodipicolinate reductase [Phycisphaerae bacterium]|nr:4-hydroxy-tetrahydrodipicolinate reductase [Phycisphaerae bacterium]
MITLAIGGYRGRMGQRLLALLEKYQRFQVVARLDRNEADAGTPFQVLIDFSLPDGTMAFLPICQKHRAALITGTTGFNEEQLKTLSSASRDIPVLRTSNFSLGINWLVKHLPLMVRELAERFDIEIVETHHTQKVDAPSGTANMLLDTLLQATGRNRQDDVIYGRSGHTGVKDTRQIGVHAIRSGVVVGKHEIIFGGIGESITITHEAHSRDTFAQGAIEAAAWITRQPPGLYTMQDVLK